MDTEQDTAGLAASGVVSPKRPGTGQTFSFAHFLTDAGIVSVEQVAKAQDVAQRENLTMGRVLVRDGLVLSADLSMLMALHLGVPLVALRSQSIKPQALALLAEDVARRYQALPLRVSEGRLTVAVADPLDPKLVQDLTAHTGNTIDLVVATPEDILEHIDISFRLTENSGEGSLGMPAKGGDKITATVLRNSTPAQMIDLLVRQALQDRASDIHLAPTEFHLRVRFRIDGILHDVMSLPLDLHPTLVSRLKIVAGMNIAERRRSQDGQFTFEAENRRVDIRVAISSTVDGELTVLRLLDKRFTLIDLDQLGMSREVWERYRRLLRLPYGMIIVCGPTGAGKSTTLYSSVLQIDRLEQNVISLEDPVEYRISDANQMQVHPEAGITFASQLRSVVRLDPDVILLGEIRDQETAMIATQAALTGHLVLTSLHANDAVSALIRLRDLGVAPYLIASSVAGVVSQRMVRLVCNNCRSVMPRPVEEQRAYAEEMGHTVENFVYGSGCNLCAGTGYRGRTGVFEIMSMSDSLRQLLLADAPRNDLWKEAVGQGMIPLRRDGMLKVERSLTTPYEMMRVLFSLE